MSRWIIVIAVASSLGTGPLRAARASFLDESGCYLGAYLGVGGQESHSTPAAFNAAVGKAHSVFTRYVDASNDLGNPQHFVWADSILQVHAWPMFFLDPPGGLAPFANGTMDSALQGFGARCAALSTTVFVIFAHEMNGSWFSWGQQPSLFVAAFQRTATILHAAGPGLQMCWVPSQGYGIPGDPYGPYYPGDSAADWVGLTHFDRDWDENNVVGPPEFAAAITYDSFYQTYAADRARPMLMAETALFDANWDPSPPDQPCVPLSPAQEKAEKEEWIAEVYDSTALAASFPNLKLLCWFHVRKTEQDFTTQHHFCGPLQVDWRIPLDSPCLYCQRVANPYFHSPTAAVWPSPPQDSQAVPAVTVVPNPCPGSCVVRLSGTHSSGTWLSVIDAGGRERTRLLISPTAASVRLPVLPIGVYFIRPIGSGRSHTGRLVVVK